MSNPYDFHDAFNRTERFREARRSAIEDYEDALTKAADAKLDYRRAKATAHVTSAAEGGTADQKKARAEELCAQAEHAMALADAMVKASKERIDAVEADRAMANKLIEWSLRIQPLGPQSDPGPHSTPRRP